MLAHDIGVSVFVVGLEGGEGGIGGSWTIQTNKNKNRSTNTSKLPTYFVNINKDKEKWNIYRER